MTWKSHVAYLFLFNSYWSIGLLRHFSNGLCSGILHLWPRLSWLLDLIHDYSSPFVRGISPFLFPWGFQSRVCLVMLSCGFLRMCPMHPHFFFSTSWEIAFFFFFGFSKRLMLVCFSCQRICKIYLKYRFVIVWSLVLLDLAKH